MRSMPATVLRAMQAQDTDAQQVWLMRIYTVTLDGNGNEVETDLRHVVNDGSDIVGPEGTTYKPYPFSVRTPNQSGDSAPFLRIEGRDIALMVATMVTQHLTTLRADVFICQRGVTQSAPNATRHVALDSHTGFWIRRALTDERDFSFQLTKEDLFDAPIGIWVMDRDTTPWLYAA